MPHMDIELYDNEQFFSNIPRIIIFSQPQKMDTADTSVSQYWELLVSEIISNYCFALLGDGG